MEALRQCPFAKGRTDSSITNTDASRAADSSFGVDSSPVCLVDSSNYDRSCSADSDCVRADFGNYCQWLCRCGEDAIDRASLARFNADVAMTPLGQGRVQECVAAATLSVRAVEVVSAEPARPVGRSAQYPRKGLRSRAGQQGDEQNKRRFVPLWGAPSVMAPHPASQSHSQPPRPVRLRSRRLLTPLVCCAGEKYGLGTGAADLPVAPLRLQISGSQHGSSGH